MASCRVEWVGNPLDVLSAEDVLSELGYGDRPCDEDPHLVRRVEEQLIPAAIERAESRTRRAIVKQRVSLTHDIGCATYYPIARPHLEYIESATFTAACGTSCVVPRHDLCVSDARSLYPKLQLRGDLLNNRGCGCDNECCGSGPSTLMVTYFAHWDGRIPSRVKLAISWLVRSFFDANSTPGLLASAEQLLDAYATALPPGLQLQPTGATTWRNGQIPGSFVNV